MKRRLTKTFLPTALVLCAFSVLPVAAEDINRIVLRVNEEIFTLHEYEGRKATEIQALLLDQRIDAAQRQERLEEVGRQVMQSTFSEMLLLSFAQQQSIRISDAEVEGAVRGLMERQGIVTDEQLQEALAKSDMTLEDLRDNARRELLWQEVVGREVQPKVKIGEEELRAYYKANQDEFRNPEQRWLKEIIVLESSGLADAELLRTAEEIEQGLAAGGEVDAVIAPYMEKELSTGLIDLDWLRADELEASLSQAAWALAPGEYSAPIAARGGYHIVHVAGLREAEQLPLSEVQDRIMRREYNTRFNRQLKIFLASLETTAYVQENLPPESVGYRNLTPDYEAEDDELEMFRAPILQTPVQAPAQVADEAEPTEGS